MSEHTDSHEGSSETPDSSNLNSAPEELKASGLETNDKSYESEASQGADKDDDDNDVFHDASIEKESSIAPSLNEETISASVPDVLPIPGSNNPFLEKAADPQAEPVTRELPVGIAVDVPVPSLDQTPPPLPPGHPTHPPTLPPRDAASSAPPLPPRKRQPFFWLREKLTLSSPSNDAHESPNGTGRSFASTSNFDLLLSRVDANLEQVQRGRTSGQSVDGVGELKERFQAFRAQLEPAQKEKQLTDSVSESDEDIDWDFWEQVVNDYPSAAKSNPVDLSLAIAQGIPNELRGIVWQTISGSKSYALEEVYSSIILEDSPHEKAIRRDLSRTSFIKNADSESLYKIIKAYSLFDPEVGYTQGMAFIAVPLLISMPESEAFGLLVKLMKDYGLREFFLPEMVGLHLRLYQFDRILEDTLPDVHIHLARQGVRSSMYASQWFLTFFAYKFPLQIVQRIFDVTVAEGIESLLRFAVGLICRNANTILKLEFDQVLSFLKDNIFDYYLAESSLSSSGKAASEPQYRVNDLVADAYDVKILPITLKKYKDEYDELHRIEKERVKEVEDLRSANGQLTQRIRRLENTAADLTNEHLTVTNELAHERVKVAKLEDDNELLTAEKETLASQLDSLGEGGAEEFLALKSEVEQLREAKTRLETQLTSLETELADTRIKFETLETSHTKLNTKWLALKNAFQE